MPPIVAEAESVSRELIVRLLDGSLQGAIVVTLVWAVCAACKSVPASIRTWLWWLACLKLVMALAAFPAVSIPVLPSTPHSAARTAGARVVDTAAMALPVEAIKSVPRAVLPSAATRVAQSMGWRYSALLLTMALFAVWWVAVLAAQGLALLATHRRLSGLRKRAHAADEHCLRETKWLAQMLELRRVPHVLLSHEVTSPQVMGFWRPCVLLPAATSMFSDDEWRMMLCHELTHVRRRDLVLGWIPALAERAFFFNPLARLAAREYVLAREAACDAAVLRALSAEPQTYGRLLVRLGVSRQASALSAAGASPSTSMLKRRLEMLHVTASRPTGSRRLWLAAVTLALAAVPFQLTARASSFLPPLLAQRQAVSVGAHTVVPDATPGMWVLQLFTVVQNGWLEGRRAVGVPVTVRPAQSGSPVAGARFGARRGLSAAEVAPPPTGLDADRRVSVEENATTSGDDAQLDNVNLTIDALSRRITELAAQRRDAVQAPLPEVVEYAVDVTPEEVQRFIRESQEVLKRLQLRGSEEAQRRRKLEEAVRQGQAEFNPFQRSVEQAVQRGNEPTSQYNVLLQEVLEKRRQADGPEPSLSIGTTEDLLRRLEEILSRLEEEGLRETQTKLRVLAEETGGFAIVQDLGAYNTAKDRVQARWLMEQLKQQAVQLDAARLELERQRALIEQARWRMSEVERQLVEALTKATRDARRASPPAAQAPAK